MAEVGPDMDASNQIRVPSGMVGCLFTWLLTRLPPNPPSDLRSIICCLIILSSFASSLCILQIAEEKRRAGKQTTIPRPPRSNIPASAAFRFLHPLSIRAEKWTGLLLIGLLRPRQQDQSLSYSSQTPGIPQNRMIVMRART